jgi:formate-dependent nitrite reductase membrane component NrfD
MVTTGVTLAALLVSFVPQFLLWDGGKSVVAGSDRWIGVWVTLGVAGVGVSLLLIAAAVFSVNKSRHRHGEPYLMPSRAGVIETRSTVLYVLYAGSAGLLGAVGARCLVLFIKAAG